MSPQRGSLICQRKPKNAQKPIKLLWTFCKAGLWFGGARRLCYVFSGERGLSSGLIAKHFPLRIFQCAADELGEICAPDHHVASKNPTNVTCQTTKSLWRGIV